MLFWERDVDERPPTDPRRSPLWSSEAVEQAAHSAATRLREASATYGSVDETVVEAAHLDDDSCARLRRFARASSTGSRTTRRRQCVSGSPSGFSPQDVVLAIDEVERAVEELIVEHDALQAVGSPRWRVIQRALRHTGTDSPSSTGGAGDRRTTLHPALAPRARGARPPRRGDAHARRSPTGFRFAGHRPHLRGALDGEARRPDTHPCRCGGVRHRRALGRRVAIRRAERRSLVRAPALQGAASVIEQVDERTEQLRRDVAQIPHRIVEPPAPQSGGHRRGGRSSPAGYRRQPSSPVNPRTMKNSPPAQSSPTVNPRPRRMI